MTIMEQFNAMMFERMRDRARLNGDSEWIIQNINIPFEARIAELQDEILNLTEKMKDLMLGQ